MREIKDDFIGGIDYFPCSDWIFSGGWGDYKQYTYGPFDSEDQFNEGIVQALQDRLPPKVREIDPESSFAASEHILYQTVRGLNGHEIVFTHGDLHTGNMVVRRDGTVAHFDWGLAGFWPEYWEFYRAMFTPSWRPWMEKSRDASRRIMWRIV